MRLPTDDELRFLFHRTFTQENDKRSEKESPTDRWVRAQRASAAAVRDAVLNALIAEAKAEGWALSQTEPSDGPMALDKWLADFKGVPA